MFECGGLTKDFGLHATSMGLLFLHSQMADGSGTEIGVFIFVYQHLDVSQKF